MDAVQPSLGIGGVWLAAFFARLKTTLARPAKRSALEPDLIHGH